MLFSERRRFVQTMCEHHAYYTRLMMSVLRFSSLIPVCNMLLSYSGGISVLQRVLFLFSHTVRRLRTKAKIL